MGQPLSEEIKTRVPADWKQRLIEEADSRNLDLSDVVREALREYLAKRPRAQVTVNQLEPVVEGGRL